MTDDPRLKVLTAVDYRAQQFGWSFYHTHDSRRSQPGYPDLHLWHPKYGQLFRELKTMKGKQSAKQLEVEASMRAAGANVEVWRPADLDGLILEQLRGNI